MTHQTHASHRLYDIRDNLGTHRRWDASSGSLFAEDFKVRLRRAQDRLGDEHDRIISQSDVAERLGVSVSTMKRWIALDKVPYWAGIAIELI